MLLLSSLSLSLLLSLSLSLLMLLPGASGNVAAVVVVTGDDPCR